MPTTRARLIWFATCSASFSLLCMEATAADGTSQCEAGMNQRSAVIENILSLGTQLSLGRLCGLQETTLHQLKLQTLTRYADCMQLLQIKGTEIQDALEAGRPVAHNAFKHATSKSLLCEQVRLAAQ